LYPSNILSLCNAYDLSGEGYKKRRDRAAAGRVLRNLHIFGECSEVEMPAEMATKRGETQNVSGKCLRKKRWSTVPSVNEESSKVRVKCPLIWTANVLIGR
jgi:hypothetical protein